MDNVMPRYYANWILTFGLSTAVSFTEVHNLLQASLNCASEELSVFRRRVFSVPLGENCSVKGRLEAREHSDWTPQVIFKDLSESWPEYEDLLDEGLPQDLLDGAQLLPPVRSNWDLNNEGAAGVVVQANFIHGGLLLSVSIFHSLIDGMSSSLLFNMWAKHMRIQQHDNRDTAELIITPDCCDYDLIPKIWASAGNQTGSSESGSANEHAWRLLGMLPPLSPAELRTREAFTLDPTLTSPLPRMKTTIFYISATALKELSNVASREGSELVVTANDVLMALIWRCTMRARYAVEPDNQSYTTPGVLAELDTTLDGRSLFSEQVPWAYMGTLIFIATTRMPLSKLISPATKLEEVAHAVRQAVASITRERLHQSYALAAAISDYSTIRHPFATFEGTETCLTSLVTLPVMSTRFGSRVFKRGGLIDHARTPRREFDAVCRRVAIFPQQPSGGFEVMLAFKEKEMEYIERDPEFSRFAKFLCH